jgi:hypothetical protein
MTVGDKVRIVGQSRFATRIGTIVEIREDEEWFPYRIVLDNHHSTPIGFMKNEVVKREETE